MYLRLLVCCVVFGLSVNSAMAADAGRAVWESLYSADTPAFAANLRAAGFPEEVVGLLVSHEINARFDEREKALQPSLSSIQSLRESWSFQRREALLQVRKEKNDLFRATLGIVPKETAETERDPEVLKSLTKAEREQVRMIEEDYSAMFARLSTETRGTLLEEDKEKMRYLIDERTSDLERILGADGFVDYDIDVSGLLTRWQKALELIHPTAQELRDVYRIRKKLGIDVEAKSARPTTKLRELTSAALVELEATWPADRFAAYKRITRGPYRMINNLVTRLGLDHSLVDRIYDSEMNATETAFAYAKGIKDNGSKFAPGQKEQPGDLSKRLLREHLALVQSLLTESAYAEYCRLNSSLIDVMSKGGTLSYQSSWIF